jgi:hypothetical protein
MIKLLDRDEVLDEFVRDYGFKERIELKRLDVEDIMENLVDLGNNLGESTSSEMEDVLLIIEQIKRYEILYYYIIGEIK